MEMKKYLAVVAFLITTVILLSVLLIGQSLRDNREEFIRDEMVRLNNDITQIQMFFLMSETYGSEMACIAFESQLRELDETVWNLGIKLDQYRVASEEFLTDPFYLEQKKIFNQNQVVYMTLLTQLKQQCGFENQTVIAYFYQNSEDCAKCDDQSFVLTDINRELDEKVSIFSYDADLDLTPVDLLMEFYNVSEFPCTVIEGKAYCGMRSKSALMQHICTDVNHSTC